MSRLTPSDKGLIRAMASAARVTALVSARPLSDRLAIARRELRRGGTLSEAASACGLLAPELDIQLWHNLGRSA